MEKDFLNKALSVKELTTDKYEFINLKVSVQQRKESTERVSTETSLPAVYQTEG